MAASWNGKPTDVEYEDWSRGEIEHECTYREIAGRSAMNKAEMIQALKDDDAAQARGGAKDVKKPAGPRQKGKPVEVDYEDWSKADIMAEASERDIHGRSSMSKADLIKALQENDRTAGQGDEAGKPEAEVRSSAATSTDTTKSQAEVKKQAPAEKGDRGPTDDRELPVGEQNSRQLGEGQGPVRGVSQPEDVHGRLYSCQAGPEGEDGRLSFLHDNGVTEGVAARVAPDCEVILNGKEATLDDLRRGDHLVVTGSPATSIAATR